MATHPIEPPDTAAPEVTDLGFGRVVSEQMRGRFLNKDGTSNSRKYGLGVQWWQRTQIRILNASWPAFVLWVIGLLLLVNGVFALAYMSIPNSIGGAEVLGLPDPFLRAFAFSVGIFTTVGTGPLHAVGSTAHWLVALESMFGPLGMLTAGGFLIARITRPRTCIRFSQSAVIAPYRGGRGFMFRMINRLPSELTDVECRVNLAWYELDGGVRKRHFHPLTLDRRQVEFFPLHWTVVHPIDARSPLRGITPAALREAEAEFLVQVMGHEETFSTRVYDRTSYTAEEVRWDAKFADMFVPSPDGVITVDAERLDRMDRLDEGTTSAPSTRETREPAPAG
jgi:inward rectifier potassium channel